jgi:hypothetical protein
MVSRKRALLKTHGFAAHSRKNYRFLALVNKWMMQGWAFCVIIMKSPQKLSSTFRAVTFIHSHFSNFVGFIGSPAVGRAL